VAKSDSKRGADRRPKGGNGTRERTAAKAAKAKPGKASKAVKAVAVKAVTVEAAAAKSAAKPAKRGKGDKSAKLNGASTALLEAPLEAVPTPKSEEPATAAATAAAAEVATPETSQDSAKGSKKAATASKASKSAARPSRPAKRKAELLVEQVAAEIVAAELDRELGGGAAGTDAELSEAVLVEAVPVEAEPVEAVPVESVVVEAEPVEVSVKTEAVLTEAGAQEKDGERKPLSPLLRYTSVALAGGDPATAVGQDVVDPASTPGVASRQQAEAELKQLAVRLGDLQERLFAAARGGDSKSRVLLILQGMDTSGKGGTVRHVAGQLDPNGLRVSSFKAPTEEELAHDFLWRIRRNAPEPGVVGVFDRSQYEDVLVARVRKLALPMVIGRRYLSINKFERDLAADGCTVVKCFLHISSEEQKRRLAARLEDPTKHWKYSPTDVDDRRLWPQYQDAYRLVLEKTSTEQAPWHIVPADRKWYRNYAITRLLVEALEGIDPKYPPGEFDLEVERKRVAES
jgi:PPK2 family polyphosphate:nucleotide phosphotransferase